MPSTYSSHDATLNESPKENKEQVTVSMYLCDSKNASTTFQSPSEFKSDRKISLIMAALCTSLFLSALDTTCVAVAVPTITADLTGIQNSIWVGSAYMLTSTALLPWLGSLASVFGRPTMLMISIILFSAGSLLSGVSHTMTQMITGRSIAGVGGGGITTLAYIVVCDLVPLASRGTYLSLLAAVWAVAASVGPPISGALTSAGQWRWVFYMNLPICGISLVLVALFLRVKTIERTWKEKRALLDWWNLLFVCSTTSVIVGFTWAGEEYAWSSVQVVLPIVLGFVGMIVFGVIENFGEGSNVPHLFIVKNPSIPKKILNCRTTIIAYIVVFLHSMIMISLNFYRSPMYFQGAKVTSAVLSGVYILPMVAVVAPAAMVSGVYIKKAQKYRWIIIVGWATTTLGLGLLSLCKWSSSGAMWAALPIVVGLGLGVMVASTNFPTQAPLPDVELQPAAVAFRQFATAFGQVAGVSVFGSVAQTELRDKLPASVVDMIPKGQSMTFAAISVVEKMQDGDEKNAVRKAFADSFTTVCYIMIGISVIGMILSFFMKDYALCSETSKDWGIKTKTSTNNEDINLSEV